jgi:3-isopropylmalate/(R)-2-methylmalate dehydratase small subunit
VSRLTVQGRAWVFGNDVNTDVMAPGLYFKSPMEEMARHCLEAVEPRFAREVQPGDIVVAGRRFGVGSAREQAALAFQHLGVGALLA